MKGHNAVKCVINTGRKIGLKTCKLFAYRDTGTYCVKYAQSVSDTRL